MTLTLPSIHILTSPDWKDYELVDSGGGQKLERYGKFLLIRPEPEAIWQTGLSEQEWQKANATFQPAAEENGGHWDVHKAIPDRWQMGYKGLKFWAATSGSRHLGVFPEQASQWDWLGELIRTTGRPVQVLNLFGYTGLASLAAAAAGAKVTHVDASKKVLTWARENQELSGLADKPIRWILDDALKFIQRDARRGVHYDGLILDPPKFGRGPKGEVWEFYKLLPRLLQACREVLAPQPLFIQLTAYAVKASSVTLYNALTEMTQGLNGQVEVGEVALQESSQKRLLSMAIFGRWSSM
jgi:23S rRNA (cytosine1962-C5)-methyltransferase